MQGRPWPIRSFGRVIAVVAACTACNPFGGDSDEPGSRNAPSSADEIITRYVNAIGGEKKLRGLKQRTVEATVVFEPQPGCEENDPRGCVWQRTEGEMTLYQTADGRMYRRMVVGENIQERGFDGKQSWQYQVEPPLLVLDDPSGVATSREDAVLHWYFEYEKRGIKPAIQDPVSEKRDDGTSVQLDGIAWVDDAGLLPTRVMWFERDTGLLFQEIEKDTETADMVRRRYSEYRAVDGVKVAHALHQTATGEGLTQDVALRFDEVHHRPVNEARFVMPKLPVTEPVPDELLALLDNARTAAKAAPKDLQAVIQHARIAFAAAAFDEALTAANATLTIDKQEPEALFIVARVQLMLGQLDAARRTLDRVARTKKLRDDQIARQRGWIEMRRFEWRSAGKLLTQATLIAGPPGQEQVFPLTEIGERYQAFSGVPLRLSMAACTVEIPVESDVAPVFTIEVDGEKVKVLLDTGTADLFLDERLARSMVITADADAPIAVGGPLLPQGQADKLTLGGVAIENVPVTMFDGEQIAQMAGDPQVTGVLGLRVFSRTQVTYDRGAKKLILVKQGPACAKDRKAQQVGVRVPFVIHESHYIYLEAALNGARGLYLVNSGMRGAAVTATNAAFAHAGIGAPPMRVDAANLVDIGELAMGEFRQRGLQGAYGYLAQDGTSDGFRLDGMLGLEALGNRFTLDLAEQVVYFDGPVTAPAAAAPVEKGPEAKKRRPAGGRGPNG
jgi:hypothetical protein